MEIRAFGGTVQDAQGIIEVDHETFDDCTYAPGHILSLLADPTWRAWVAIEDGRVVGFAAGFATSSLAAARWEVDELAVRPAYQRRGIATRLVANAVPRTGLAAGIDQARALIARENVGSQRAFGKNDFTPVADVDLLLYQVSGRASRPLPVARLAADDDAPAIAALANKPSSRVRDLMGHPDNTYLVAADEQRLRGFAELIHVRTLQYEGLWLESLSLATHDRQTAKALFAAAIREAKQHRTVDRIGYLAAPDDRIFYDACIGEGFQKIDEYKIFCRGIGS